MLKYSIAFVTVLATSAAGFAALAPAATLGAAPRNVTVIYKDADGPMVIPNLSKYCGFTDCIDSLEP